MAHQLQQLWDYAEGIAAAELKDKRPTSFEPIDPNTVKQTIAHINEALQDKEVDKSKAKAEICWKELAGQYGKVQRAGTDPARS